jgi:hypothetical protein
MKRSSFFICVLFLTISLQALSQTARGGSGPGNNSVDGSSVTNAPELASLVDGRDTRKNQQVSLNEDGSCSVQTETGKYSIKNKTTKLNDEACKYLAAAKRIREKVGHCDYTVKNLVQEKNSTILNVLSSSNNGAFVFATARNLHPLSASQDMDADTAKLWNTSFISEGCLCAKLISKEDVFSVSRLNLGNLLFDGPYYKSVVTAYAMSANECSELFEKDSDKEIVKEVYSNLGLK